MSEDLVIGIVKAKTLYEVLQVSQSATKQEIVKQYKRLSIKVHPDKCRHARAEEAFKKLNEAHRILADDRTREQYDVTGSTHDRPPPTHRHYSEQPFHFTRHEDPFFFFFAEAARQQEAYYRQQRSRARSRSNDEGEESAGSFKFAWFPIVLMIVLLFGGPILQNLPGILESLSSMQFSFSYSKEYPFEHRTKLGGVKYFIGPGFDTATFLDENKRATFEKEVTKKWMGILEDKCRLERTQRDRVVFDRGGAAKRADTPTPSCTELTKMSHLRR